jgi:hypothetical protein
LIAQRASRQFVILVVHREDGFLGAAANEQMASFPRKETAALFFEPPFQPITFHSGV